MAENHMELCYTDQVLGCYEYCRQELSNECERIGNRAAGCLKGGVSSKQAPSCIAE
jgi:hypothetical protein